MVFLIGTNHKVQYIYKNEDRNRPLIELVKSFAHYLEEQAEALKITLIAEELNEEAISTKSEIAKDSTAHSVATKHGINHKFCDPDIAERKALGIPSNCEIRNQLGLPHGLNNEELEIFEEEEKKYWHKREQFWFDNIKDRLQEPIIFICGSDHVERFESLMLKKGYEVRILVKNWCNREE